MNWVCSHCGKDARDHTMREIHNGRCKQVVLETPDPQFTATEYKKVNPEAVEDTGEEFQLTKWERAIKDEAAPSRQKLVDEAETERLIDFMWSADSEDTL